jgi:hypothetical protein
MKKIFFILFVCAGLGIGLFVGLVHRPFNSDNKEVSLPGMQTPQNSKPASLIKGNASENVKPASAQNSIALTNLPEHIQPLVVEYGHQPTWANAKKLTPADKELLLKLYRQEASIVKKRGLTIALGFIGDEEVVEVFKHTLSDQYTGRKLTSGNRDNETDEETTMHTTVEALGFLANKSDSAYELLKNGFDPGFWKNYCKFIPATGPDFYGFLTGRSIQAIGWSGRPDVTNILESLKPLPLVNYLDNSIMQMSFNGAVVSAAFANDMIVQHGLKHYKYLYLNLDARLEEMTEWEKQGNGLEWRRWAKQKKGAPIP